MAEDADDRKHDPSPRAMQEAADRGELPRSTDLSGTMGLLAGSAVILWTFPDVAEPVRSFALRMMTLDEFDVSSVTAVLTAAIVTIGLSAGPIVVAAALTSTLTSLAQTRFQIAPRALEAKFDKLDPLATFQRLYFSREPLVALVKGLVQVGVLGGVVVWASAGIYYELPRVTTMPSDAQLLLLGAFVTRLVSAALPAMLLLAGVDYAWSYWTWWRGLMRTDQQVRDDSKEAEGDPHVRGQRRKRMREIATRQGIAAVKSATVVVTNPTHYAIALRYQHGEDAAPVVVAKGVDHLATLIRAEAKKHDIPLVEDRRLARALHAQVKIGAQVPGELYGAVARVLAIVYRRKKRRLTPTPARAPRPRETRRAPRRSGANRPANGS